MGFQHIRLLKALAILAMVLRLILQYFSRFGIARRSKPWHGRLEGMFIGFGTLANVILVSVGSIIGTLLGSKFPTRTQELITELLGLFTLVLGGRAIASGISAALSAEVGEDARLLVILGALLLGAIVGSAIRLEDRMDSAATKLRNKLVKLDSKGTFVEGAVTATLVFCIGPLAVLGSLSDGLGNGTEQLLVKAVMDGFAAIAFAASLGIGVMASIIPLAIYQGAITLLGYFLGDFLSDGQVDSLGAVGGVILLGLGLRLAGVKKIAVGNLLPALLFAPIIVAIVSAIRG
jgi:uncharacterized membrane protein YqgA involved in biofilm formation